MPIDGDGYVTQKYCKTAIPNRVWQDNDSFIIERPHYIAEGDKFVAVGVSGNNDDSTHDQKHVFVEWDCEPGTRKLIVTCLVKDNPPNRRFDWDKPSRIILAVQQRKNVGCVRWCLRRATARNRGDTIKGCIRDAIS